MDGVVARYRTMDEIKTIDAIYRKGYFFNLPEMHGMTRAATFLMEEGFDIHILSSVLPPGKNPYALDEKNRWLDRYLPVPSENRHFVWYEEGMSGKGVFASGECDILIDDDVVNLLSWQNAGGRAIRLVNEINLKTYWGGTNIYYENDPRTMYKEVKKEILYTHLCRNKQEVYTE